MLALIPAATAGSAGQLGTIVVLKDGTNPTAVAADHSTPQQVRDGLFGLTTKNIVTDARSTNAHLLFSNM